MSDSKIASELKSLRVSLGCPAKHVTEMLKTYGFNISEKTLYGYESGLSMPNADIFIALCKVYECRNPMALFEDIYSSDYDEDLLDLAYQLNDEGREKLLDYAHDLISSGKYIKKVTRISWMRRKTDKNNPGKA